MKIASLLLLFVSFTSWSQEWQTNFAEAKEMAIAEDKPIILVFQGSDWCAPCIKLDREIWQNEDFISYAKENYIMLLADFPRKKQNKLEEEQQLKNNQLAETYNREGNFPLVVILDKTGKVLGQTAYKKITSKEYINLLNSFLL
jgi:thioredoxin-related protein